MNSSAQDKHFDNILLSRLRDGSSANERSKIPEESKSSLFNDYLTNDTPSSRLKTPSNKDNTSLKSSNLRTYKTFLIVPFIFFFTLVGFRFINVLADVPGEINFQGKLTDINGVNAANGNYDFRLRIYDTPDILSANAPIAISGANTWIDIDSVAVTNGIFNLKFQPDAESLATDGDLFLQVCFNSQKDGNTTLDGHEKCGSAAGDSKYDKVFTPRKKITSNPYSIISRFLGSDSIEGQSNAILSFNTDVGVIEANEVEAGKGKIYFDGTKFRCSEDGGNFFDCFSGGGSGITSLNGENGGTQTFATGTTGTDFNIDSTSNTHTFNFPNASASARGLLSASDWTLFNNKVDGSGTTGQVAHWDGANSITGDAGMTYDGGTDTLTLAGDIDAKNLSTDLDTQVQNIAADGSVSVPITAPSAGTFIVTVRAHIPSNDNFLIKETYLVHIPERQFNAGITSLDEHTHNTYGGSPALDLTPESGTEYSPTSATYYQKLKIDFTAPTFASANYNLVVSYTNIGNSN